MAETVQPPGNRNPSARLAAVGCWGITLVQGFVCLVYAREVGLSAVALFGIQPAIAILMDKVGFFLFGAAGLVIILTIEPYYRRGSEQGILAARFLAVTAAGLLCLALSSAFLASVPGLADAARPSAFIVAAEVISGVACLGISRRLSAR